MAPSDGTSRSLDTCWSPRLPQRLSSAPPALRMAAQHHACAVPSMRSRLLGQCTSCDIRFWMYADVMVLRLPASDGAAQQPAHHSERQLSAQGGCGPGKGSHPPPSCPRPLRRTATAMCHQHLIRLIDESAPSPLVQEQSPQHKVLHAVSGHLLMCSSLHMCKMKARRLQHLRALSVQSLWLHLV